VALVAWNPHQMIRPLCCKDVKLKVCRIDVWI
jgi:hypothetical protein